MSADPLRRITTVQAFDNPGHEKSWAVGGSTRFELECGRLINGTIMRSFDKGKDVVTIESWDPKMKMPKRSVMRMTQKEWDES